MSVETRGKNEWNLVIGKGHAAKNYWKDIWRYRELFYILSWRDVKVRYKQTVVGAAWSIIRPLLTTLIFYVVFNRVARLQNPVHSDTPYMLLIFAGMLPWQFFSNAVSEASQSLLGNSSLITKVYFPRLIIPASSVITSFVDFAITFAMLLVMMILYGFMPGWEIIFLPFFIILVFICAFGIGLFLTALNVKFRDFRYILPFIIQFGLYITPVGYSSAHVPEKWRALFSVNPMVGVIDGFRFCLLREPMHWESFTTSLLFGFFFLLVGILYFRKMERSFADNI